mmetsp:Transcript_108200/g.316447  ORF Transcript_108200/g.316447 Transcript_108200/m.316447 type:complete len:389 (+) Transcript_108200:136-1302(+)
MCLWSFCLSVVPEPGAQDRDVVHDVSLLLDPARPGLRGQRLRRLPRLRRGELGDDPHGLLRAHELPNAVRAQQHEAPVLLHLERADLGDAGHARDGPHRVPDRAGHGEPGVHLALEENPVRHVALEAPDLAAGRLDAPALALAGGLVVAREVLRLELAAAVPREDGAGVPDVRGVEDPATAHRERRRGAAQGAVELALRLAPHALVLRLREGHGEGLLRVILELWMLHEIAGQCKLHKVGHIMATRTMPIKDAVDACVIGAEYAEVVLVRALWLQALLAGPAHLEAGRGLTAGGLRHYPLVGEAPLPRRARGATDGQRPAAPQQPQHAGRLRRVRAGRRRLGTEDREAAPRRVGELGRPLILAGAGAHSPRTRVRWLASPSARMSLVQ